MEQSFLEQAAKGRNSLLAYLMTLTLIITGNILGGVALVVLLAKASNHSISKMFSDLQTVLNTPERYDISLNTVFLGQLIIFVVTFLGLLLGIGVVHRRSILTVVNGLKKVRWLRIFTAFVVWFAMSAAMQGVDYLLHPTEYTFVFQAQPFLGTLLIALFVLPLQTSCEEFVFRGWLMQGIGSLRVEPYVPLIITAVLFGVLHFTNPEVAKYGYLPMAVYYIGFGVFMGLLTLLDDGMELALGLHFGNNFFSAIMVSFTSSALQTNTIFRTTDPDAYLLLCLSAFGATAAFFIFKYFFGFAPMQYLFRKR